MKSILMILAMVGCATSASIVNRGKDGNDIGSWCRHVSTDHFLINQVTFGNATWGLWFAGPMGAFDRSLRSIAKFDGDKLDGFMKTINASKSWTTGTYTVDCANAAWFPDFEVHADLLGVLTFKPSDYVDLKNPRVGQCAVLLQPGPSYAGLFTIGNPILQKYCDPSSV